MQNDRATHFEVDAYTRTDWQMILIAVFLSPVIVLAAGEFIPWGEGTLTSAVIECLGALFFSYVG